MILFLATLYTDLKLEDKKRLICDACIMAVDIIYEADQHNKNIAEIED